MISLKAFMPWFFLLFLLCSISAGVSAVYVQVSAVGGPFVTDSNILVIAKVFDNNGSAKNNIDLNTYIVNLSTGAASDINYHGSVQGYIFRVITLAAGDYNLVATDLNDSVTASVQISVRSLKTTTSTFNSHSPPFNTNVSTDDINFTLQAKGAGNADTNAVLRVRLMSDANNSQAAPTIDVNANGFDQNTFDTAGLSQGLYYIDVNNGLALIPVTVFKFKAFLAIQDDLNNATTVFGQSKTVTVIGRATNFDGNDNYTISSADVNVTTPSGSTSALTCTTGSQLKCTYTTASNASAGDYTVNARITVGSDSIKIRKIFSVQTYSMRFYAKEFTGGKAGKEKMPSVYPANTDVNFEAHFVNTSTGSELSGADINTTFCMDQNIVLFIQKVGEKDVNLIADTTSWSSLASNYCNVSIRSPTVQGTYNITAQVNVGSEILRKSTVLTVQNFLIFAQPVAPDTYDPNTPSGKFTFYKGESVGFNPNYVDLNGQLNPRIARVRQIKVFDSTGIKTFSGSDATWTTTGDKNILTLSAAAVNTLSGGFKQIEAIVDVSVSGLPDVNSVVAFGMFKLSVMSLSAVLVDSNIPLTASQKSSQFGPPSVGLDENIYLKITALNGSTGVSGATVTLQSMRNVDNWTEVDISSIPSRVSDSNGVAILDIGKLQNLGLASGGYFIETKVTTNDGNTDTVATFFESRRFVVFLEPIDTSKGTQCDFAQNFRKDQNASFVIRAFNPQSGFGSGDVNVIVNSAISPLKVMYFGTPSKPQFPPSEVTNVNFDTNTAYPCRNMMSQGPGEPQTSNLTMITMRKANDGNWTSGFYNIVLTVDANGGTFDGNREVGRGFMQSQSFGFNVNPTKLGSFGPPTGKPGQPFDINVVLAGANGNVTITAELVDIAGGGHLEMQEAGGATADMNIGYSNLDKNGSLNGYSPDDCNNTQCTTKSITIRALNSAQITAGDKNVLSVIIPSNAKLQEYLIQLSATDASGDTATGEIFLQTKLFKLVNFTWNTLYGAVGLNNLAPMDWNTSGISYTQVSQYTPGGQWNQPMIDRNFLVDYTNRRLVVDMNADRNFLISPDVNVSPGSHLYNSDGNVFMITDVSMVGGQDTGVKYLLLSALDANESSFGSIGTYPTDTNFTIPLLVKDVNGLPIDVNVSITNIAVFNAGNFFPQNLSATSCSTLAQLKYCNTSNDFNSLSDQTDANGFALINMRVAKPGSRLMLEVTVWNTSSEGTALNQTQKLQPFEGPTMNVKKFTINSKITGPTMTIDMNAVPQDYNILVPEKTNDGNRSSRIRFYNTDINLNQGASDHNGVLGDINSGITWRFTKLYDGNGTWFVFDDDTKIIRTGQPYNDQDTSEGDFAEGICLDLNSDCPITRTNGTQLQMYFDHNATDANIFDTDANIYLVYSNPWGTSAPNYDANLQVAISLTSLSGNPLPDTYSISNVRLNNYATWTSSSVSCSACTNRTGTTLINLGNFASRNIPGNYEVSFTLTVGSSSTEERVHFETRRPSS